MLNDIIESNCFYGLMKYPFWLVKVRYPIAFIAVSENARLNICASNMCLELCLEIMHFIELYFIHS